MKTKRILMLGDRQRIAQLYIAGTPIMQIAREIDVDRSVIYREIHRGYTGGSDKNGRPGYDPELSQKNLHTRWKLSGGKRKEG